MEKNRGGGTGGLGGYIPLSSQVLAKKCAESVMKYNNVSHEI
jgi:hypothetical protein